MNDMFRAFAQSVSSIMGSAWSFVSALLLIVIWAVTGPFYHYSDSWQLVINTGTTIVTFLMVFLIQCTQNRDTKAIQLKLNELLRGVEGARTGLVNLEKLTDQELKQLESEFSRLARRSDTTNKQ